MKQITQRVKYITSDFISAGLAWLIFNIIRFFEVGHQDGFDTLPSFLLHGKVIMGQILVPFFWLIIHYYSGYYNKCLEKSRLSEFFVTSGAVLFGTVILFFTILLNTLPQSYDIFYNQIVILFLLNFIITYAGRLSITQQAARKIQKREWTVKILILGTGKKALDIRTSLEEPSKSLGYTVIGHIEPNEIKLNKEDYLFPVLGGLSDLESIIKKYSITELVIAIDGEDDRTLLQLLYSLYKYKLAIKLPASYFKMLTGGLKIQTIAGVPMIDVTDNNFPPGEKNIKQLLDKLISVLVLVVLLPVYIYLMIRVRFDSPGPVFFKQERIGYLGKPFLMYKFRTMVNNAEEKGPSLATKDDSRITNYGRKMRKYRWDELPQFWNVLKGDMSLVGPRPERKFYIDQIVEKAPYYYLLHNVRPGITSWGMVKYGYASNVDQMIARAQYDILYYENMSILMDFKIIIYTVRTILTGRGL